MRVGVGVGVAYLPLSQPPQSTIRTGECTGAFRGQYCSSERSSNAGHIMTDHIGPGLEAVEAEEGIEGCGGVVDGNEGSGIGTSQPRDIHYIPHHVDSKRCRLWKGNKV